MPRPSSLPSTLFEAWLRIASVGCLLTLCCSPALAAPGADWPLYRHDVHLSRHSPGKGKLVAPVLRWRAFLGGSPAATTAHDADLDGTDDVLAIEGGSLSVRSWSGGVLWKTAPIGATAIVGIADVDGDGLDEVVARLPTGVQVLSGTSGAILWTSPASLYPKLHLVTVADFNGDGAADIVLADQGGALSKASGAVSIYGFKGTPGLLASTPETLDGTKSRGDTARVVDVDGDGRPDIYLPIHESDGKARIYAFSGKTGSLLGKAADLDHAGCHHAVALPQKSGAPLVICTATPTEIINPTSMRGAYAMTRKGEKLARKWKYLVPDEASDRFQAIFVGDVDADGKAEIVASEHVQGAWRIQVLDAETGKALAQLAGDAGWLGSKHIRVLRVARVGAEGPAILQCSVGKTGTAGPTAQSRLIRWSRAAGFTAFADLGLGVATPARVQTDAAKPATPTPAALVALSDDSAGADFVVRRDQDGDGRLDQVVLTHVADDGQVKILATRDFVHVPSLGPSLASAKGRKLMISTTDGFARVVDSALKTVNDGDGDGLADLTYGGASNPRLVVARTNNKDKLPLVLVGSGDRLRVYDPKGAGPLAAPTIKQSIGSGSAGMNGTLVDLDGDGSRELVVRHRPLNGSATIDAWNVAGAKLWTYTHPGIDLYWATRHGDVFAPVDINGDGAHELMLGYREPGTKLTDAGRITLINGKTGQSMWAPGRPCSKLFGTTFSVDDSGKELAAILSIYNKRYRCRLSDGEVTAEVTRPAPQYGVPMLRDLDGDGDLDVIVTEGFKSVGAERQPGHATIWQVPGDTYFRPSAMVPSGKDVWVATAVGAEPMLQLLNGKTGTMAWQQRYAGGKALDAAAKPASLPSLSGLISVADLAGDGKPSLLFHTNDGWLYAVAALDGSVRWSMNWGGVVGDPIVADLDGDGEVEILVTSPDGYLNALDHDLLGTPGWVRENAGKGPATTAAEDVDQQEMSDRIHLNWAALAGAQGYAVQVADSDGGVIMPLGHVGPGTSMTVDGLNLHLGRTYVSTVRAWIDGDKGKQYSRPTSSDGVKIVDLSPPWIENLRATPAVVLQGGGDSVIEATLYDTTRLARVNVQVSAPDGAIVAKWQRALAVRVHELARPWPGVDAKGDPLPAGTYKVTVVARDGAGHEATASVQITRCAAGEVIVNGGCGTASVQPDGVTGPDVDSDAGASSTVPREPDDDCCSASPTSGPGHLTGLLALLACVLVVFKRRSHWATGPNAL